MLALALFAVCQPPNPAREAVQPLAALAGEYDTVTTAYDTRTGAAGPPVKGRESITVRARGQIVVCARDDDSGYDDLLVYQYDSDSKRLRGYLFMPLGQAKPRGMSVTAEGSAIVLDYEPTAQGNTALRTRETITRRPGGGYARLVEHEQPDGSRRKRREIVGTPAEGK